MFRNETLDKKSGTDHRRNAWLVHWTSEQTPADPNLAGQLDLQKVGQIHLYQQADHKVAHVATTAHVTLVFVGYLLKSSSGKLDQIGYFSPSEAANQVLLGYLEDNVDSFAKLRGMFSFVIWDSNTQRLIASRDPLGFLPLFFYNESNSIRISNSIQALLTCQGVSNEVNRVALVNILLHRWPNPDETYFASINKILPAHYLEKDHSHFRQVQYWDPNPPGTPYASMPQAELDQFDALLERSILNYLSLGKAGVFLSGGLDSVSIAAIGADTSRKNYLESPLALSVAFPHPDCNEEERQRSVAQTLGLEQIVLPFAKTVTHDGLIIDALEMSQDWPTPIQNPWRPVYYHLAGLGYQQGCRVILTGIGGDDWLTVNPSYMADLLNQGSLWKAQQFAQAFLRSYDLSRTALLRFIYWNSGFKPLFTSYARRAARLFAPGWLYQTRFNRQLRSHHIPEGFAPDPILHKEVEEWVVQRIENNLKRPEPTGPFGFHNASAMSYTFLQSSTSLELEEEFEVGRRLGMQVLHPYWDANLIEFLCKIPPEHFMQGGREKGLVRQAVARRFPGLGFERQRKVSASNFYVEILLKEGKNAWQILDGLETLTKIGVISKQFENSLLNTCLSSHDLHVIHKLWEFINLEAWVRSRVC